jgi:hypothetical protein
MTTLRRSVLAVMALVTAAGAVSGFATSLGWSAGTIGAGTVPTTRCTNAGLSIVPNLTGAVVTSVTVASVPATCGGSTLRVTADDGASTGSGSMTVPGAGGAVVVTLGGAPVLAASVTIHTIMEGP